MALLESATVSESRYQIRPDPSQQGWQLRRISESGPGGMLVRTFPTQEDAVAVWETLSARLHRIDVPAMATLFDAEGNAVQELRPPD